MDRAGGMLIFGPFCKKVQATATLEYLWCGAIKRRRISTQGCRHKSLNNVHSVYEMAFRLTRLQASAGFRV